MNTVLTVAGIWVALSWLVACYCWFNLDNLKERQMREEPDWARGYGTSAHLITGMTIVVVLAPLALFAAACLWLFKRLRGYPNE